MKKLFPIIIAAFLAACSKDEAVSNINVEGYWNVLKDTTFTSLPANSTADLFHLFRGPHAFYRLSFLKTHDFSNLNSRPRTDSVISFFDVEGKQLKLPNHSASFANVVAGFNQISSSANEMIFTREVVLRRSTIDGKIELSRMDTIRYVKVTDPIKIAYFDNYLKTYHK